MPKKFSELDLGSQRDRRRESLRQAIPSLLDEMREEKEGEELKRAERRWAHAAASIAKEELPRRMPEFDDTFVKSLLRQIKCRSSLSPRQLDGLNRIVKGFGIDDAVRERFETRTRVVIV